jgi:hypothetical protein
MSLEMARRADEWDAVDVIPTENIREVTEYTVQGGRNEYSNLGYLNVDTTGNPEPYTEHLKEVLQFYNFPIRLESRTDRLSSCFASCLGATSASMNKKSTDEECIDEPEGVINFKTLILTPAFSAHRGH